MHHHAGANKILPHLLSVRDYTNDDPSARVHISHAGHALTACHWARMVMLFGSDVAWPVIPSQKGVGWPVRGFASGTVRSRI